MASNLSGGRGGSFLKVQVLFIFLVAFAGQWFCPLPGSGGGNDNFSFWALSKHEWCPSCGIRSLALNDRPFPGLQLSSFAIYTNTPSSAYTPAMTHCPTMCEVCAPLSSKHQSSHLLQFPVFCTTREPVRRGRAFASQLTCCMTKWNLLIEFTALGEVFHHPNNEFSKAQWKRMILVIPRCLYITANLLKSATVCFWSQNNGLSLSVFLILIFLLQLEVFLLWFFMFL